MMNRGTSILGIEKHMVLMLFFSYRISTIITDKYQNHSIYHEDFCWYSFFISKESHLLVYTENGDLMVI